MMMTNQVEQHQRPLATLEGRLVLGSRKERAVISKAIAGNVRAVDEQRSALNRVASGLERIRETRIVIPPQSASPVAPNGRHIIMLAILAGLMLGMLGAFVTEFLVKARREAGT